MKTTLKLALTISFLFANVLIALSQGGLPELPGDPGIPVPLDGGVLLALLAGGGIVATLFKKNKKK